MLFAGSRALKLHVLAQGSVGSGMPLEDALVHTNTLKHCSEIRTELPFIKSEE